MRKGRIFLVFMIGLIILDVIGMKWYCDFKIDMIEIPVASKDIYARTKIDESMIDYIEVPSAYVKDNAYVNEEDIIGKYSELGYKIEKGSLFYIGDLFHEGELPDAPSLKLKKGQTAFTLPVDLVKLAGNSIVEGQKVDVYISIDQAKGTPVVDNLIKAVRVLSVKDRNGVDINDEDSSHVPYVAILAINDEQITYLKVAERIGEIDIMAPSVNYAQGEESILNESSAVLTLLQ